jgi:hypothetical protein
MKSDSKIMLLIVLIIAVIIVSVVIFRNYYKTDQERADYQNRLYVGITVGILASVLFTYGLVGTDDQEYGLGSWLKSKSSKPAPTPAPAKSRTGKDGHAQTIISGTNYHHGSSGNETIFVDN